MHFDVDADRPGIVGLEYVLSEFEPQDSRIANIICFMQSVSAQQHGHAFQNTSASR